jgi:hypothetical protein
MLCCFDSCADVSIVLSRLYKAMQVNPRQHMAAPVPATTCERDLRGQAAAYGSQPPQAIQQDTQAPCCQLVSAPSVTVDFPLKMLALGRAATAQKHRLSAQA